MHSAVTLYRHRPRCVCTSARCSSPSASIYMATASRCVCTSMVMRIDIERGVYRHGGRVLYTPRAGCSCMPWTLHTHFCGLYMHCGAKEQELDDPDKDSACENLSSLYAAGYLPAPSWTPKLGRLAGQCAMSSGALAKLRAAAPSAAAQLARPQRPPGSREPSAAASSGLDPSRKFRLPKSAKLSPRRGSQKGAHRGRGWSSIARHETTHADLEHNEIGVRGYTKKR
jgi:hypothetical protein